MQLSAAKHAISEWCWEGTFNFNEIMNNPELKQGIVRQIMWFISHFYLKLNIKFWNNFAGMVLYSIDHN